MVELETNIAGAGDIVINTCQIEFNDKINWQGEYYTDFPITLTAVSNPGYRFIRWENDVISNKESISVSLGEEGIVIKAVFEEESK